MTAATRRERRAERYRVRSALLELAKASGRDAWVALENPEADPGAWDSWMVYNPALGRTFGHYRLKTDAKRAARFMEGLRTTGEGIACHADAAS